MVIVELFSERVAAVKSAARAGFSARESEYQCECEGKEGMSRVATTTITTPPLLLCSMQGVS